MNRLVRWLTRPLQRLLLRHGYRIQRADRCHFLEPLLYQYISRVDEFFFVQIGANDGVRYDPFYPFVVQNSEKIRGIVVEPMKDAFEQLKQTYAAYPNVTPVNVAIHNIAKEMKLYRVDPAKQAQLPAWAKGTASFNREHLRTYDIPDDDVICEIVSCMTLEELLARHDVSKIDLLLTDTEGYDFDILMSVDFDRWRPTFVHFEHGLPDGVITMEKLKELLDRLYAYDYLMIMERGDGIAYQRSIWHP